MITVKSERDIVKMRSAGKIVANALLKAEEIIRPGITTGEINAVIDDFIRSSGAIPSFYRYHGYPASACISVNDIVVHGIPGKLVLSDGDIVSIDVGAVIEGFHGDAARTFPVGNISHERQRLIDVTKASFFEGLKQVRAGKRLGDIGEAIQTYAESHGFSVVRVMVGHGIGRALHEEPNVPNFGKAGTGLVLKAGNTIAIEPMINAGGFSVKFDADGWTCRTSDGSDSAHYENTVLVTNDEPELLTI